MAGIFDHKTNIVVFRKFDPSRDITRSSRIDGVDGEISKVTLRVTPSAYSDINCRTRVKGRIAVSDWRCCQPGVKSPVGAYVFADLLAISGTLITWSGKRFVINKPPIDSCIKGIPSGNFRPTVICWSLFYIVRDEILIKMELLKRTHLHLASANGAPIRRKKLERSILTFE
jgi:hypothetical protein